MKKYLGILLLAVSLFGGFFVGGVEAEEVLTEETIIFMFGRDDCGFCKAQFEFLNKEKLRYEYLNIVTDEAAKDLYNQIAAKHELAKVTPITVIGERVIAGFNAPETTGESIKRAVEAAELSSINSLEDHINHAPKQEVIVGGGCSDLGCELGSEQG